MLQVEELRVAYGPVVALDGVSFDVAEGSITAVLGANGAGKTSLLRAISGLVKARGSIAFGGRDIVGAAPEDDRPPRHRPRARGPGRDRRADRRGEPEAGRAVAARARRLRRVYGLFPALAERRAKPASTLSGGERQMLVIGRALMARPRLLLLDEPSLGLAPKVAAQIVALLRDERDRSGLTVLLVEQNARSALSVADKGVVLSLGRVAAAAEPDALAADETLRHAYLGF